MAFFLSAFLVCLAVVGVWFAIVGLLLIPFWITHKIDDSESAPAWLRSTPAAIVIFALCWSFEFALAMTILRTIHPYIRG